MALKQRGVEVTEMDCGDIKVQADIGYEWSIVWVCLRWGTQKGRFSTLAGEDLS